MKTATHFIFLFLSIGLFLSCETAPTGDFIENQPPNTYLTVDEINREGDFRLSSQIRISWWGTDSDGYIVGYEYAINDTSENAWSFTTTTDSTFILPITEGNEEDDVLFKIRAVDNDGAIDKSGAELIFPIVNSNPTVELNLTELPPDTLFSIASFGWTIDDPDGFGNIQKTEVAINDVANGWTEIPITEDENRLFISLEIDNSTEGEKSAKVYQGRSFSTLPNVTLNGLRVGETNTFYVRTVDNAGATSNIDSTSWFIKQQTSRVLFFNDFRAGNSSEKQAQHLSYLAELGINPDIWIINDGDINQGQAPFSSAFPAVKDPTLTNTLARWDHIYWLSSDLRRNISFAQEILGDFFDEGGSLFAHIPITGVTQEHPVFDLIPVDSIANGNFLILNDKPVPADTVELNSNLDMEVDVSFAIDYAQPLKAISGAKSLYTADFDRRTSRGVRAYDGYEDIAIENSEGNLIYFSLDVEDIMGNNNVIEVLTELLVNRLNFKQ
ncbi:MAG: hypothetical protein JJ895_03045 [Balneolaceae bacterium]|nr:hypothetical protein [Balneolaceae bacterium]